VKSDDCVIIGSTRCRGRHFTHDWSVDLGKKVFLGIVVVSGFFDFLALVSYKRVWGLSRGVGVGGLSQQLGGWMLWASISLCLGPNLSLPVAEIFTS